MLRFLCLMVFLVSCSQDRDMDIYNKCLHEFAIETNQNYGLKYLGGGGRMCNKIEQTSLLFSFHNDLSLDEARSIFVAISREWLEWINENEDLREYLAVYPFERNNIEIALVHNNFTDAGVNPACIVTVGVVNDRVFFNRYDIESQETVQVSVESYSELMSQGSSRSE
ncbi:hypothetical protein SCG7109_AA_00460 [Chlamydiales bacterium SCGC AG-110-M15]|nr:hypothetical protein SCG7109_AA_00460 [Chlamydiales bacterium SCGC AG-110-M15]